MFLRYICLYFSFQHAGSCLTVKYETQRIHCLSEPSDKTVEGVLEKSATMAERATDEDDSETEEEPMFQWVCTQQHMLK